MARLTELEPSCAPPPFEHFSRIVGVLYRALCHASELQRFAQEARGKDDELCALLDRWAATETERAAEVKRLLARRTLGHGREAVTSAAFAAGDGASDADVAPDSERRSVRVWPAQ